MYEKKHALPNKKIHTPKGIARLTVTAATMAAMTGSSLISPFTAFAQTGDGGTQHPAVMSPIAAHAGAASGTGAKSAAQTIADLQKAVDEAKAKEDAAKASYDEAAGPYNEAASARDQANRTRTRRMRRPQPPAPPTRRRKQTSPQRRQAPAVRSTMRQNRRSRTQRQPSPPHERCSPSASPSSSRCSPPRQRHRPS